MGTMVTPPIDLYEESNEDLGHAQERPHGPLTHPQENGVLDRPAQEAGEDRLDQVL